MYIGNMVQGKQTQINYKLKKPVHNKKEDWIIVPNTHEPIIDKEKFYAVQEIIKSRTRTRTKSLNLLLRGLLVCKECGKKMGYSTSHFKNGNYTQIYTHCHTYQSLPKLKLCTSHCMNYTNLENAVIEEVQNICRKYLDEKKCKQIIDDNNNNVQNEIELNKEKSNLAKAIEVLDFQVEKLYEDKLKGLINDNDFSRMYEKKVNERDSKTKKLEKLNTNYRQKRYNALYLFLHPKDESAIDEKYLFEYMGKRHKECAQHFEWVFLNCRKIMYTKIE